MYKMIEMASHGALMTTLDVGIYCRRRKQYSYTAPRHGNLLQTEGLITKHFDSNRKCICSGTLWTATESKTQIKQISLDEVLLACLFEGAEQDRPSHYLKLHSHLFKESQHLR